VLVVGVEGISPYLAPGDVGGVIYGDGAGALVLARGDTELVGLAGTVQVQGRGFTAAGPLPPVPSGDYRFHSPDRAYRDAMAEVRRVAGRALADEGPFDAVLPYGAVAEHVRELAVALGAPATSTLATTGCLGSAGFPVALDALRRSGARPRRVGAVAVAGGAVWAGLAWRAP
jgi:3-oxoacyl-[acyl-carrier-protein] synthase III